MLLPLLLLVVVSPLVVPGTGLAGGGGLGGGIDWGAGGRGTGILMTGVPSPPLLKGVGKGWWFATGEGC